MRKAEDDTALVGVGGLRLTALQRAEKREVEKIVELSWAATGETSADESVDLGPGPDDVEVLLRFVRHMDRRPEIPGTQELRKGADDHVADLSVFTTPQDDGIVVERRAR